MALCISILQYEKWAYAKQNSNIFTPHRAPSAPHFHRTVPGITNFRNQQTTIFAVWGHLGHTQSKVRCRDTFMIPMQTLGSMKAAWGAHGGGNLMARHRSRSRCAPNPELSTHLETSHTHTPYYTQTTSHTTPHSTHNRQHTQHT